MILPMGSNLILCVHEKHHFIHATHSCFTDKMNSSYTNLQPPDWCCDVCNVKLNWTALSLGGRQGWQCLHLRPAVGCEWASGHGSSLHEPCLLPWLLYLFLCASWIAQAFVFKCFRTQLWLTASFACSVGVSAYRESHLLQMMVGLTPVTASCTLPTMSKPWRFGVDHALQNFLSFSGATSRLVAPTQPLRPPRAVSFPPQCTE